MRRLLAALVVVAAVLGAWLFGVELPREREQRRQLDSEERLFDFAIEDVDSLQFLRAESRIVVVRDDVGWAIEAPITARALGAAVRSHLEQYRSARAAKVLAESLEDGQWALYGLEDRSTGRRDIRVSLRDGTSQTLQVGNESPSGAFAYARVQGTPRLLLVERNIHQLSWARVGGLRDDRLFDVEDTAITHLRIGGPSGEWSAVRDAEGRWWRDDLASDLMLSRSALERVAYDLSTSHVRAFERRVEGDDWRTWGLAQPYGRLEWWTGSGASGLLEVGNDVNESSVFARRNQEVDLLHVSRQFVEDCKLELASLVDRSPVRLNFDTADSVVLRWTAGPRLRLIRSDGRWDLDTADSGDVEDPDMVRLATKNLVHSLETTQSDRLWWIPEGTPIEGALDAIPVRLRVYRGGTEVRDLRLGWKNGDPHHWLAEGDGRSLHRIDRSLYIAIRGLGLITGRLDP